MKHKSIQIDLTFPPPNKSILEFRIYYCACFKLRGQKKRENVITQILHLQRHSGNVIVPVVNKEAQTKRSF